MGAHDADVVAAGQSGSQCLDLADKLIFIDTGRLLACDNRLGWCIYPVSGWPTVVPLLAGKRIYSGQHGHNAVDDTDERRHDMNFRVFLQM
jgi:hypothetical protein